jgi:hypothetical protein
MASVWISKREFSEMLWKGDRRRELTQMKMRGPEAIELMWLADVNVYATIKWT